MIDPGSLFTSTPFPDVPDIKPKRGMFGGGNLRDALVAAAAGFMARRSPQVSNNLFDSLQRKQILADQEAQYQRRRQDTLTDQQAMYDYKLQHPEPPNNDTVNDYNYIAQTLGKDAADQYLRSKTNPIVMTPYGPMPYSAVSGAVPTAPVGKLTPIDDGGPTAPPSATFPRPY
jgi:hypothetical protein